MQQFFGWLSSELKDIIKKVDKLTSTGNKRTTIATTKDDLFLLSEVEVNGANTFSYAGEGSQYAYYKAGNSKVKKLSGSVSRWWLRSPRSGSSSDFCVVDYDGSVGYLGANGIYGVAFAYCI
jgi:hypothetical protein